MTTHLDCSDSPSHRSLPMAFMVVVFAVLCLLWAPSATMARPTKSANTPAKKRQKTAVKHTQRHQHLARKLQRWLKVPLRAPHRALVAQANKSKGDDDLPPDIMPVAPLPNVFRKVKVISQPTGVSIAIKDGTRSFPCVPANRTPCTFEVTGQGKINLSIVVTHAGRSLNYYRSIEGRSIVVDLWLLKVPTSGKGALGPKRVRPKQPVSPKGSAVTKWVLVGVSVAVVGISVGVIGYALSTREHLGLRLLDN